MKILVPVLLAILALMIFGALAVAFDKSTMELNAWVGYLAGCAAIVTLIWLVSTLIQQNHQLKLNTEMLELNTEMVEQQLIEYRLQIVEFQRMVKENQRMADAQEASVEAMYEVEAKRAHWLKVQQVAENAPKFIPGGHRLHDGSSVNASFVNLGATAHNVSLTVGTSSGVVSKVCPPADIVGPGAKYTVTFVFMSKEAAFADIDIVAHDDQGNRHLFPFVISAGGTKRTIDVDRQAQEAD